MEAMELPRDYWVFQARPEVFNLRDRVHAGKTDLWKANQYAQEFKAGDIVYFYQSGKEAGIYGWGMIESPTSEDSSAKMQPSVRVVYKVPFIDTNYITRDAIQSRPEWSRHKLFTARTGTNFKVSLEQAQVLNGLIREYGYEAPEGTSEPTLGGDETPDEAKESVRIERNGTEIVVSYAGTVAAL